MTYKAVFMPDQYAQGSTFGIGFDTRIVALESQYEDRSSRGNGRRRYNINLDVWSTAQLYELYKFYMAVGRGALFSFKFKDWLDYATTSDGVTHNGEVVTGFDNPLQLISGRTYRLIKTYFSQGETITRFLRKVNQVSFLTAVNGGLTNDYVLDHEEGIVTFGDTFAINQATFGCEFYTQVRFTKESDDAFEIALLGKNTGSLPSVSLIEDLTPHGWSQEWPAGGAIARVMSPATEMDLNQFFGRVWHVTPADAISFVVLPELLDAKAGGPHFLIFNASAFVLGVKDDAGVSIATISSLGSVDVWIGVDASDDLFWVVT